LATEGLSGQAATEDIKMFARKGLFSSMGRTAVMATVAAMALTVVEPSLWRVDGPSLQGRARSPAGKRRFAAGGFLRARRGR
jgi:hypothetical protein